MLDENTKDNYYHYGTKKYSIGDEVEYNGIEFYVNDLTIDSTGYSARLLTVDELHNNLGYGNKNVANENVPSWVYSNGSWVLPYYSGNAGKLILTNGNIIGMRSYEYSAPVRPVVTLKKSALE